MKTKTTKQALPPVKARITVRKVVYETFTVRGENAYEVMGIALTSRNFDKSDSELSIHVVEPEIVGYNIHMDTGISKIEGMVMADVLTEYRNNHPQFDNTDTYDEFDSTIPF